MTGQKLRVFREFRNYSQEYIADKLGITQNAYSRIENNQTKITADRLMLLAGILNVPLAELMSDRQPALQFSEPSPVPAPAAKEDHWKDIIESTSQLYRQVICGKDEKIAFLENEILALREEKNRIIRLVEKLAGPVSTGN
jgi:transcriptional regulator with XRE-family HTH domain